MHYIQEDQGVKREVCTDWSFNCRFIHFRNRSVLQVFQFSLDKFLIWFKMLDSFKAEINSWMWKNNALEDDRFHLKPDQKSLYRIIAVRLSLSPSCQIQLLANGILFDLHVKFIQSWIDLMFRNKIRPSVDRPPASLSPPPPRPTSRFPSSPALHACHLQQAWQFVDAKETGLHHGAWENSEITGMDVREASCDKGFHLLFLYCPRITRSASKKLTTQISPPSPIPTSSRVRPKTSLSKTLYVKKALSKLKNNGQPPSVQSPLS